MKYFGRVYSSFFILTISLFVASCTVKFIADYDEVTDQLVTEVHKQMEWFFLDVGTKIGTPEADYENYINFYNEIKVDISTLKLRASSFEKNEITLQQIDLLSKNLNLMEELHKTGLTDFSLVEEPRRDFNIALGSILKLELAKKRGEKEE